MLITPTTEILNDDGKRCNELTLNLFAISESLFDPKSKAYLRLDTEPLGKETTVATEPHMDA